MKKLSSFIRVLSCFIVFFLLYEHNAEATSQTHVGINLDGSSEYADVLNQTQYNNLSKMTVEALVMFTGGFSTTQTIVSKTESGGYSIVVEPGVIKAYIYVNGAYSSASFSTSGLSTSQWYHVAFTYDGSNLRIYLDGTLKATTAVTATSIGNSSTDIFIGAEPSSSNTPSAYFQGQISEIRIWNIPLSTATLLANIDNSVSGTALMGNWKFDSYSTGSSYDTTSYGNDAIVKGFDPPTFNAVNNGPNGVELSFGSTNYGYKLWRNSTFITNVSSQNYTDNVATGSQYAYQYQTYSTVGESLKSTTVNIYHARPPSSYVDFGGNSTNSEYYTVSNLPVSTTAGAKTTVEFWMYWDGNPWQVPIGFNNNYFIYCNHNYIGFTNDPNTSILGAPLASADRQNHWIHIAAVFYNGAISSSNVKLYINGTLQTLDYPTTPPTTTPSATVSSNLRISGINYSSASHYTWADYIASVVVWNGERTQTQIRQDMLGNYGNGMIGEWNVDQLSTGRAYDLSANSNDAVAVGFPTTLSLTSSNITDIGMTVNWTTTPYATSYVLTRGGTQIYSGANNTFNDSPLVSDTDYTYSLKGVNSNGETNAATATYHTAVGSLQLISDPSDITFSPSIKLNGSSQNAYGTFTDKLVVRDTRKTRNGWHVTVQASPMKSSDGTKTFPNNMVTLSPVSSITQTEGPVTGTATIVNSTQIIDGSSAVSITSASSSTGQGTYQITFPSNALTLTVNPANAYAKSYSTTLTWSVVAGP